MPLLESHAFSRAQAARRIAASLVLGVAMTQFVLGLTLLRPRLSGRAFLAYWGVCFLLVVVVLFLALLDIWEIRGHARRRTRDLVLDHFLETDFLERLRHGATEESRQAARDGPRDFPPTESASGKAPASGARPDVPPGKDVHP